MYHYFRINTILALMFAGTVFFLFSSTAVAASEHSGPDGQPEIKASFNSQYLKTDMSDFRPGSPVIPTGDTIKIALMSPFSGPASINGQLHFMSVQWVAHMVNKNGGIMVDGKKKLIQVLKGDTGDRADRTKKVAERMALLNKVDVFWGTSGSHLMKVINDTARRNKIISMSAAAMSDELQDVENFSPYSFMTSWTTGQVGRGMAYYYGQIRKKEKKFYILCQDYSFGRLLGEGFRKGLKEYYPEAEIVGEDYHKLILTDFAPYLEKIRTSGAEVIFTGDWIPDGSNLLKQARKMGITIPIANLFLDEPNTLNEIGVEGTKNLVNITQYGAGTNLNGENPTFPENRPQWSSYLKMWHDLWKNKWQAPYNSLLYQYPLGNIGSWIEQTFWLLSVIERAGSTDADKIIKVWEGDVYQFMNGKTIQMRACDHKAVQDLTVIEYVPPEKQKVSFNTPPYHWWTGACGAGPSYDIPAAKVLPVIDPKLSRCQSQGENK